ncbi:MAG: hypothetical protein LBD90_07570, partial [Bifidobacteriaceae bacterium]|nr:hypothetical protein [Bifidobacteriaceae bacterium]
MTAAREAILASIRAALADVPALPPAEDVPVPWAYGGASPDPSADDAAGPASDRPAHGPPAEGASGAGGASGAEGEPSCDGPGPGPGHARVVGLFAERCGDYGATVVRAPAADAAEVAARLLADRGVAAVAVPPGLDGAVLEALAAAGIRAVG